MKKLFIILILCSVFDSFSQGEFNRAYHEGNESVVASLVNVAKCTYFNVKAKDYYGWNYLYKHDYKGNLAFRKLMPFAAEQMTKTNDQQLLVAGRQYGCGDMFPCPMVHYISKTDTNGATVFSTTCTIVQTSPNQLSFRTLLQYTPDSSYYAFTDSCFYRVSKTGSLVSKLNLGLTNISSSILLQNNTILLSARQNSVNSLIVISPSGSTLSALPFPFLLNKMSFYDGQKIMALATSGQFVKLSPALAQTGASTFSTGVLAGDFVYKSDSVYAILSTTTALSNYALMDTSFNFLSVSTTTTEEIYQKSICLNNNRVAILSNCIAYNGSPQWWENYTQYFPSLSQIGKTSANNFLHDVSVVSVEKDSLYVLGGSCYLRAKVKVKNTGNTVITSFKLNCFKFYVMSGCGEENYYEKVIGQLAMLPGDSMIVTTDFVQKKIMLSTVNYCFYATLPNKETDKVFGNNIYCRGFSTVSLDEISKDNYNWKIFPNPFTNAISIESEGEIGKITLSNALGMELKTCYPEQNDVTLNTVELPAGIYFVAIETKKGKPIKKVVKN